VYDIVRFAGRKDTVPGPRLGGQFGGLLCLGITEVDPARGTLLMGRFISKERNEPPDIDVDFEHQRREEVIQYIYKVWPRPHGAGRRGDQLSAQERAARQRQGAGRRPGHRRKGVPSQRWFDSRHDLLGGWPSAGWIRNRNWRSSGPRWPMPCWAFRAICRSIRAAS
jgi:error-prone DNA polymerase